MDIEDIKKKVSKNEEKTLVNAKKYLSLMEAFDVEAGNMEENIQSQKDIIMDKVKNNKDKDSEIESIIDSDDLISDFQLIRNKLKTNIKGTTLLLDKFTGDIGISDINSIPPEMVQAYSELIKSSNSSMKLLIEIYGKVSQTQNEIKKLVTMNNKLDEINESSTTINTINFVGTTKDMIASIEELRNRKK